jgi:DNA-binding winged helix-turn-helix (wHTH) protein
MRVRFGDCVLDSDARELRRAGRPVHLTGKAFQLLEVLVERRPSALSKDQLQDLLWPDAFVAEANVANLVSELRTALGDDPRRPASIRTVYGFGYAFCGEVEDGGGARAKSPPRFGPYRLLWKRKEIVLSEGENILGRGPESIEWIDRDTVSRRHARIVIAGDSVTLEDLASKNGTYLRGERLEAARPLADGDEIRLGSVPLKFRVLPMPGSTASAVLPERSHLAKK